MEEINRNCPRAMTGKHSSHPDAAINGCPKEPGQVAHPVSMPSLKWCVQSRQCCPGLDVNKYNCLHILHGMDVQR